MTYKNIFLALLFLLLNSSLSANDSSFYAEGSNLIPLQETSIELKKEVLNLTRKGKEMDVQVRFEFHNPDTPKTLTVGFVTPPTFGDVSAEESEHPQIRDFQVMVNGKLIPFQIKNLEKTDFKLSEESYHGYDFVYYFEVPFQRGKTIIQQIYTYRGGSSTEASAEFSYRLTNAKGWANKVIEDFEVNVHFGEDAYFSVPYSFWKNNQKADWQIIGVGKMSEKEEDRYGVKFRMVKINKGYLQFRAQNFQPDYDIWLTDWHAHNEVQFWLDSDAKHLLEDFEVAAMLDYYHPQQDLAERSKEELRWIRNYLFAKYGYVFKSKDLQSFFEQCNWYIPNFNTKADPDILTEKERVLFEAIVAEEGRR